MTELFGAIEEIFGDDGPLCRLLPGYAPRRAQIDMALAVAETLTKNRGRLVVEAGTGTGKSLAYLIPALLSDKRVVVATGTRALQDQLVEKDAPLAAAAVRALFADRDVDVVRMKGRQNYLCLFRYEQRTSQQGFGFAQDDTLLQIGKFAASTKTGDRAELVGLPDNLPVWSEIDAGAETCLGSRCPVYEDCWVVRMRRAAESARIVVVNHHLLCADQRLRLDTGGLDDPSAMASVIPHADAIIVDEAHALPDVATDYFGISAGSEELARLIADVRRFGDASSGDARAGLIDITMDLEERGGTLFSALRAKSGRERARLSLRDDDRLLAQRVGDAQKALVTKLQRLAEETSLLQGPQSILRGAEREGLIRRAERMRAELLFLLGPALDDTRFVVFVEASRRGVTVTAAPIDVATPLSATLFQPDHPVILTSATLAIAGDARPFLFRVGVGDDEGVSTRVFPSPFQFQTRAALYCPSDMPEPDEDTWPTRFDDEATRLLTLSRGGALFLFTSWRGMDDAFERLAPVARALGIPCARQGERPRAVLLDELRAHEEGALLFATHSFWEGVDVSGKALRLVLIDRLPFSVPSDPLVRARADWARQEGKDPFADVAVPEAALALKQGVGRLLRSVNDAGVVAVLDGRLRRRRYGRVFLDALPPLTRIGAWGTLEQFWTRHVEPVLGLAPAGRAPQATAPEETA